MYEKFVLSFLHKLQRSRIGILIRLTGKPLVKKVLHDLLGTVIAERLVGPNIG